MFIELHLKSDRTAIIAGLHHIVKIAAAASGDGTVIERPAIAYTFCG